MTANRLCEPESKLGVWERWLSKVFLPLCNDLKLADMYEAMDLFHKHCVEIEDGFQQGAVIRASRRLQCAAGEVEPRGNDKRAQENSCNQE